MQQEYAIEMENISKAFGEKVANRNVSLAVKKGEVHALLGENGAGKSTLMNMLSGIYTPDSGTIKVNGETVNFVSPKDSMKKGIGMIHQHFKLIDVMSVKDNIIIGQKTSVFNKGKVLAKEVSELSDRFGLELDPEKKVYEMSVGEKQTLEIIKVLFRGAEILIMDEPTAVLTPQEIKRLFKVIRNMKEQGCSIIIITHKLNEVMEISDRITVLRKGESIETVVTKDVEVSNLIEMMVGKKIDLSIDKPRIADKKEILKVNDVTVHNAEGEKVLSDATFSLNTHEILGIAGVANSGQKELCESLVGLMRVERGKVIFEDKNIVGMTPKEITKLGVRLGFVPEDRLGMGLLANMGVLENVVLREYQDQPGITIKKAPCIEKAERLVEELEVQVPDIYSPVRRLSGGNIQKVLLGREIDSNPKVLITAYAVRGLDIGASYKIYDMLNEQKKKGVGVIFVGEDLDVLMEISDRIVVMCHGEITGIVDPDEVTKEEIGLMMAGEKQNEGQEEEVSA